MGSKCQALRHAAGHFVAAFELVAAMILALLALTLPSWPYTPNGRVNAARPLTAEETRIVEAVRQHFLTNGETLANVQFDIPERHGEGWLVFMEYFPSSVGGHAWLEIDKNGNVSLYMGGA